MSLLRQLFRRVACLVTFSFPIIVLSSSQPIAPASGLTFNATYGLSPAPFTIDVLPDFITQTKLKASLTRYAKDLDQPDFTDGPPRHNVSTVRDYWVEKYDWAKVERELNAQYVVFVASYALLSWIVHAYEYMRSFPSSDRSYPWHCCQPSDVSAELQAGTASKQD